MFVAEVFAGEEFLYQAMMTRRLENVLTRAASNHPYVILAARGKILNESVLNPWRKGVSDSEDPAIQGERYSTHAA